MAIITPLASQIGACSQLCLLTSDDLMTFFDLTRLRNPTTIMAYIVQLHNGIYSRTAVDYLKRVKNVLDRSKTIILVAHQFTGDSIMAFNETIGQLNVSFEMVL